MKYYLAIDVGASSGRHILGHIDGGKLVLDEIYRFYNGVKKQDGALVWDTEQLFGEILAGIAKCSAIGKIPYSIAIDTWGVDYVLLDKDDKPVLPAYAYRDERTAAFFDTAVPFAELYKRTGIQFQTFNTVYQLLADKAAGRLDGAESMLMLPEYFSYLLTGKKAHEYTAASTTGLLNAVTRDWDYAVIDGLGLPKKLFYEPSQPGRVLGGFTAEIRKTVGFDALVVLAASHDTASAVAAVPRENAAFISSGTWSLLGIETEPILTEAAMRYNYSNEGALFGKVRFLKNIMGLWLIQRIRAEDGDRYGFSELADMAEREAAFDWRIDINAPEFLAPESMTEAVYA
ncbi:MAG: rhamnulokinase, partial [Clostridiales bacterium]|nr:rhamnulokinase [Clostridiales bacterium]